jgi:hypothetical protein
VRQPVGFDGAAGGEQRLGVRGDRMPAGEDQRRLVRGLGDRPEQAQCGVEVALRLVRQGEQDHRPDPGGVEQVEIWSDAAQVRLTGDTLFLLRFPDGWRVSAAACRPQGEAPYQCEVQG